MHVRGNICFCGSTIHGLCSLKLLVLESIRILIMFLMSESGGRRGRSLFFEAECQLGRGGREGREINSLFHLTK